MAARKHKPAPRAAPKRTLRSKRKPTAVPPEPPKPPRPRRDDPVAFRSTRSQAGLIRDALRAYAKGMAGRGSLADRVETLKTSMLCTFLADQIALALANPMTPPAPKKKL